MNYEDPRFFEVSMVSGPPEGIRSKWQANFMQLFPIKYDLLPAKHEYDKDFFEKYWSGDNYTTYEQFIADNS